MALRDSVVHVAPRRSTPARRRPPAIPVWLGLVAGLLIAGAGRPTAAGLPTQSWALCAAETERAERGQTMPLRLLAAIARVEAGRWNPDRGEILAWPWTVTAEGRGRFLPDKRSAIAEVEALRARGVSNIDVGCMQINLHYHPEAFKDLEAAFDPRQNVGYALAHLKALRDRWGSWTRAVGNYHSNTPGLSGPYRAKVFQALNEERRRAIAARRAARTAARAQDPT